MKLLLCRKCHDVFSLTRVEKTCGCGEVSGKYVGGINAEFSGDAIPLAIDNCSLIARMRPHEEGVNAIYDAWHGKGKIQCWLLVEGAPNFETIKQVEQHQECLVLSCNTCYPIVAVEDEGDLLNP